MCKTLNLFCSQCCAQLCIRNKVSHFFPFFCKPLVQGSATYGSPSNFIRPAYFNAHKAHDLFFTIESHLQPRRNVFHFLVNTVFVSVYVFTAIESAVKCLIFRWRPCFFSPLEWWWAAGTLLGLNVIHRTKRLPTPALLDKIFRV